MKSAAFLIAGATVVLAEKSNDNPTGGVVELLEELRIKTRTDGENELKAYNKFACWCENSSKRKTDQINDGKRTIEKLGNAILLGKGKAATAASEIEKATKKLKKIAEIVEEQTNIREKENTEFQASSAKLTQQINGLEKAISVLSGAGKDKTPKAAFLQVTDMLDVEQLSEVSDQGSRKAVDLVQKFVSLTQQGYNPASGTIQGILKSMYETFVQNLQDGTVENNDGAAGYEKLMQTKREQKAETEKYLLDQEQKLAELEKQNAANMESLQASTDELNANGEFFDSMVKNCNEKSDLWDERKKQREGEMEGIEEALELLKDPDSRALFTKSASNKAGYGTKTGLFLQVRRVDNKRDAAVDALEEAAKKAHAPHLALMALRLKKSGHFDAVIKDIDAMQETLAKEQKKDQTNLDECKERTHTQTAKKQKFEHFIERNDRKIMLLEKKIEDLTTEILETKATKKEDLANFKQMSEDRDAEHDAYKAAKKDDQNAAKLLEKVIETLEKHYKPEEKEEFLQKQEPEFAVDEDQAPELKFSDAKSNKNQNQGIVSLLKNLVENTEQDIKTGNKNEAAANKEFQQAKVEHEKMQDTLQNKIDTLKSEKSDTIVDEDEEGEDKDRNRGERRLIRKKLEDLKPGCDWIRSKFTTRFDARTSELEGLRKAKSILQGMVE